MPYPPYVQTVTVTNACSARYANLRRNLLETVDDYATMENWEHSSLYCQLFYSFRQNSVEEKCINSVKSTKVQRELRRIQRKGEPFLIVSAGFTVHDVNLHK